MHLQDSRQRLSAWRSNLITSWSKAWQHNTVLDNPGECSLNKSRKVQSASVPRRYIMRRSENVASHTATDIQKLLAREPKGVMRSLDQIVASRVYGRREQSFTRQSHTTSIEGREGKGRGSAGRRSIIPIPREATSVATMMGLFPVLNSFRTQSRSFCCLSPWIARNYVRHDSVIERAKGTYTVLANHLVEGT